MRIYLCTNHHELYSETETWHDKICNCRKENTIPFTTVDEGKELEWSNGEYWGDIEFPCRGMIPTYYNPNVPCYYSYSKPRVDADGHLIVEVYDHDDGIWSDTIDMGVYNGIDVAGFITSN